MNESVAHLVDIYISYLSTRHWRLSVFEKRHCTFTYNKFFYNSYMLYINAELIAL